MVASLTEDKVRALFVLAGFRVRHIWQLPNQYWPEVSDYEAIRRDNPWYLVLTEIGPVQIGKRKKVLSIDWEFATYGHQSVRGVVTADDVTKDTTYVHAWTEEKALEYLKKLHQVAMLNAHC